MPADATARNLRTTLLREDRIAGSGVMAAKETPGRRGKGSGLIVAQVGR
jgi:hypothetical protein